MTAIVKVIHDRKDRFGPVSDPFADRPLALHFRLFRHFESVVDLDPEVANRAFQLGVPEQQLNGPKVFSATVDQRRLGAPQRVRAVVTAIEAELLDPGIHNSGVLVPQPGQPSLADASALH